MDADERIRMELERAITAWVRVRRLNNQFEAAAALGISQSQVSRIARGEVVSIALLLRLWQALGGRTTLILQPPHATHAELIEWHQWMEEARQPEERWSS